MSQDPLYYPILAPSFANDDPPFFIRFGYGDGSNIYAYVRSQPTKATDPLGLFAKKVCIEDKTTYTTWKVIDFGASKTVSFPNPSPMQAAKKNDAVTEVTCMYERTLTKTYRCHPCCWKTPPTPNTGSVTCKQIGTATYTPAQYPFVEGQAISWAPPWWPPGVPGGIEITVWQDWADTVDLNAVERGCVTTGTAKGGANVTVEGPAEPNATTPCPSTFGPGCTKGKTMP